MYIIIYIMNARAYTRVYALFSLGSFGFRSFRFGCYRFIQELTSSEIRFFILMMNILDAEHLECLPFIVLDILLLLNGFGERDIDDFSILEPDHD